MLRLASDADVHGAIIRGLRRRLPEIDVVRVQDALPEGRITRSWPGPQRTTGSSSLTTVTR
jgi:hypothetical protein